MITAADVLYELGALEEYLVEGKQRPEGYARMDEEDLGRLAAYLSADHDGLQAKDLGSPVLKLIELADAAQRRATQLRSFPRARGILPWPPPRLVQ